MFKAIWSLQSHLPLLNQQLSAMYIVAEKCKDNHSAGGPHVEEKDPRVSRNKHYRSLLNLNTGFTTYLFVAKSCCQKRIM